MSWRRHETPLAWDTNFVAMPRNSKLGVGISWHVATKLWVRSHRIYAEIEIPEWFGRPYLRPYSVVAL